ncbi:MAG: hypothetical protein QOH97_5573 [Actinoplanes sp.]|nr:hypothetical protein [Actinoplanes sp.]
MPWRTSGVVPTSTTEGLTLRDEDCRYVGQFVPLAAALESLGVDPREVEALVAGRAGGEAA